MEFYECSALTGDNINEIFVNSCKIIDSNIKKGIYDLDNPSNGIRIYQVEDGMKIDKKYEDDNNDNIIPNSRITLNKNNHLNNKDKIKKNKCICK